ncbi:UNVERIFIED_ORG: small neutral amino acid transporter SnatA (MarC family) [Methylobacterium sp. SuP10 SLI 274]|nr:small neutral amino acid transporter SnatA (MarC family) [Methylobacterium sp. SuP10 SLI 274]
MSLAALRIAGGLFVAAFAWTMLTAPEAREARKHAEVEAEPETGENLAEVAFFPLTLPFTTGPGTIAVAIALGANRPSEPGELAGFFLGASLAALAIAGVIRLAYGSADRVVTLIGSVRARVLGRLSAFLLLCVGTQITVSGVSDVLGPLIASQRV